MPKITIFDEKLGREKTVAMTLECLTEKMTVREIILARIFQEVSDYNRNLEARGEKGALNLLVTPTNVERELNSSITNGARKKPKQHLKVNWEEQYQLACDAFERNGFFVIIGDTQAEGIDDSFAVEIDTEISFVKLTPLIGG